MIRLVIFFAFVVLAMLGTVIQTETDRPNDGLPLVKSALVTDPAQQPHYLFAPCPIAPRNFPLVPQRKA